MTESLHEPAMPLVPPTPGALIKAGRQSAGIHLAVLSANLKVTIKQLEALEADQFDRLSGTVFARALAAKVCRFIKIDPDPVLALMPANVNGLKPLTLIGADQSQDPSSHSLLPRASGMGGGLKGWLVALLLVAIALVFGGNWIASMLPLETKPEVAEVVPTMPPTQEPVAPDAAQAELPKAMVFDSANGNAAATAGAVASPLTPAAAAPVTATAPSQTNPPSESRK